MRVAVTGGTGFVGRHVVAELQRRGVEVIRVLRPGSTALSRPGDVQVDFTAAASAPLRAIGSPDVLMHLAWGGLPNYDSLHHFQDELPLHFRWLRQLVDDGLGSLVATGTCFEYGMRCGALAETMPTQPHNAYGFAKDALRRQLEFLQRERAFELTWARPFYVHGEGQSDQSLLPQLRRAVARGDAAFAMSGGEQLRDFLPVTEVAQHLVDLAASGIGHGIVNVCAGHPVSVRRLVEGWLAERGWQIALDLGRLPYSAHEPMAFWGDRRKLDQCLAQPPRHARAQAQRSPTTTGDA